ncbi:hypothetical protein F2Q70_00040405 [Brassica cretica]|uniref:Uncharacterized protein n=1 Tax=Brassica cretica TaxID=69181 RepID=A0A8S9K2Q7_BRACR|nr:hypothetical protein F2Q70_00040405 [Brassica cretica]
MTMRRNLEGSGHANSKIATPGSTSRHSGQKNIQHKPSKTRPDQLQSRISYGDHKYHAPPATDVTVQVQLSLQALPAIFVPNPKAHTHA